MKLQIPVKNLLIGNSIVLIILIIIVSLFANIFHLIELKSLDARYQLRNQLNKTPIIHEDIININIDDYSRIESGKIVEWPKKHYTELINKISLSQPKVIACDILFAHSNDTLGNGALVESIARSGVIVSPYFYSDKLKNSASKTLYKDFIIDSGIEFMPEFQSTRKLAKQSIHFAPFNQIVYESLSTGFVNIDADADGVIRRLPIVTNIDGKLSLSLFFQALCDYLDYDPSQIVVNYNNIKLMNILLPHKQQPTNLILPIDQNGYLPINYLGKYNQGIYPKSFSAWDIINSNGLIEEIKAKFVILSDVSTVGNDFSITPIDNIFPRSYLYSNAVSSILNQDFLTHWSNSKYVLYTLILLIIIFLAGLFLSGNQFIFTSLLIILFHIIFNFTIFIYVNQIMPMVTGFLSLSSIFLFTTFYRYSKVEHEKGVLEGSLKSYLSPHLMSKIEDNPDLLKLGGERKRISVIFADLVNFTTFCDTADPAEVQEVLSLYFAEAADVIFSEGGIIDKYLGDGILAFFENEGDTISSPIKAARACIALQQRAQKINKRFESQNRFPFVVRVGITTGYAKVGNIGPPEKIDYTIIGSVVNLASRLQGVGADNDIIVDQDTQFFLKDEYTIESCGEQVLKGFIKPISVFKIDYD